MWSGGTVGTTGTDSSIDTRTNGGGGDARNAGGGGRDNHARTATV